MVKRAGYELIANCKAKPILYLTYMYLQLVFQHREWVEHSHLPQTCMSSSGTRSWQKLHKGGLTNAPGTMTNRGYIFLYLGFSCGLTSVAPTYFIGYKPVPPCWSEYGNEHVF